MFFNIKIINLFSSIKTKQLINKNSIKYFSSSKQIPTILVNNALHNLNILVKNNKNSYIVNKLKHDLINANYHDIFYINESIKNIFLSFSIQEALTILDKEKNNSKIQYYQLQYQFNYYNNIELEKLFKNIENDIKQQNNNRNTYNLLPFYYNIYLSQTKSF